MCSKPGLKQLRKAVSKIEKYDRRKLCHSSISLDDFYYYLWEHSILWETFYFEEYLPYLSKTPVVKIVMHIRLAVYPVTS